MALSRDLTSEKCDPSGSYCTHCSGHEHLCPNGDGRLRYPAECADGRVLPDIHTYMPSQNGGRNRTFVTADGVRVMVAAHEDDARGEAAAIFLADAPALVARLRQQVQRLSALVPAKKPARMFGPGCVRMRDGEVWLLNRRDRGWGEFGIACGTWDDLFRRFDVVVTDSGRDAFGDYWTVEPTKTRGDS